MKIRKGEFSVPKRNKEQLTEVKRNSTISAKQETHRKPPSYTERRFCFLEMGDSSIKPTIPRDIP